ncbi:aminodeoxychorismate lyase [Chitiniphilus shinanonensis]|uniref:aminodeoxychorismate lyase n=1 Tax=Chitiniphilus shinanonensis TaxID=553088 RepID=A0ABQ6BW15_9NEIS|nr:aminodeoxychorismate lyase [Chitiniphilus shinanonensis]GLS05923.1 aminodeoxychorismate lyase [Chitiniphilus shinanonensis]
MRRVNGQPADEIGLNDRGFQFGDGVFRTLRCEGGGLRLWARQYAKLARDCAALGIVAPDEATLLDDIAALEPNDAAVKIVVTRGDSPRGYGVPADCAPNRVVQVAPLPPRPPAEGVRVRWCEMRAGWQPRLAGIKHLNRLENVLARAEWQDAALFEGLLLDRDGHVLEGTMSNVLALSGRVLFTPRLDGGGVAGVMREAMLDLAPQLGIAVRETPMTPAALLAADRLWLCNSLIGLVAVRELAGQHWGAHALDAGVAAALAQLEKDETKWL